MLWGTFKGVLGSVTVDSKCETHQELCQLVGVRVGHAEK